MAKKLPFVVTLLLFQLFAVSQSTFFKHFLPTGYEGFKEVVPIAQGGFAFITDRAFYKVDAQGNLLIKKDIQEGMSSFLGSIKPDGNGGYWLVSHVFETLDIQKLKLYRLDQNGNILLAKELEKLPSMENPILINSDNKTFYLVFRHIDTATGNAHLDMTYFDADANKQWHKELSQELYNSFSVKAGENGKMDVCFMTKDNLKVWLFSVDKDANSTTQEIHFQQPADKFSITTNFCKAAGDGYIFIGDEVSDDKFNDGFMYKTNNAGNVEWVKRNNIYFGDSYTGIAATNNGYILLATTGTKGWGDDVNGDIALIKTDLQGNQEWIKAFGSSKRDYARFLDTANDGSIIFGGQAAYPGKAASIPILCKTDAEGNIATTLPLQLSPSTDMTPINSGQNSPIQRMVKAALAENGDFILGANDLEKDADAFYSYLIRSDKNGNGIWAKKIVQNPADVKTMQRLKDGNFIAISEQKDLFANQYNVVKLTENGDTVWTNKFAANNVKDIIGTSDGGCLITGALDISFVNYEVMLIKFDGNGNKLWQKTIGERALWETGRKIIETPDNGFLIVGNTQKEFDIVSDVHMLKIDKDGNKLFAKNFSGGIATNLAFDVTITADNNYLLVGTECKQPFDNKNILLLKTDSQGKQLWQKTLDLFLLDEGFNILPSDDGGFYISGTTGEANAGKLEKLAFVIRLDVNGNKLWDRYYGREGYQTTAVSLLAAADKQVILFGNTQHQYGQEEMYFVKVNGSTVEEPVSKDSFIVFPNPATKNSSTTLLIKNNYAGSVQVILYNAAGKQINSYINEKVGNRYLQKISLHGLASGVYFIAINIGDERHTQKLWIN